MTKKRPPQLEHHRIEDQLADDPLFAGAWREIQAAVRSFSYAQANDMLRLIVIERDLVPRSTFGTDQPSASEAVKEVLAEIRRASRYNRGSFAGAHNLALRRAREMGIVGLDHIANHARTHAQCEDDPPPGGREGGGFDHRFDRW